MLSAVMAPLIGDTTTTTTATAARSTAERRAPAAVFTVSKTRPRGVLGTGPGGDIYGN